MPWIEDGRLILHTALSVTTTIARLAHRYSSVFETLEGQLDTGSGVVNACFACSRGWIQFGGTMKIRKRSILHVPSRIMMPGMTVAALLLAACGSQATTPVAVSAPANNPMPSQALAAAFPSSWSMYADNPTHNDYFAVTPSAPAGLRAGYNWRFAEFHAQPLHQLPPETAVVGQLRASVRLTQTVGNALGVSAVSGVIYAESDSGLIYALNAATGAKLWSNSFLNAAMGNPVVESNRVFVGLGNSNFSFRELLNYKAGLPVMRGTGENAVVALNSKTGAMLWSYSTLGEDMPTPAYVNGSVIEANGNGNIFALDSATGSVLWKTHVGGFDSMSSPVAWTDPTTNQSEVVASFSDPDQVFALSTSTGKVLWHQGLAGSFDTGMSDAVSAVDPATNTVIVNGVVNPQVSGTTTTVNLAMEALDGTTGAVKWYTELGRGPIPPAFKAGVPMIHDGTIFMNAPGTDVMHGISEATGKVLWSYKAGYPGRAAPTFVDNYLMFSDGPAVFVLDPTTGQLIQKTKLGGLFGIVNPVVVGGTVYVDNSYNWVEAIPLSTLVPKS